MVPSVRSGPAGPSASWARPACAAVGVPALHLWAAYSDAYDHSCSTQAHMHDDKLLHMCAQRMLMEKLLAILQLIVSISAAQVSASLPPPPHRTMHTRYRTQGIAPLQKRRHSSTHAPPGPSSHERCCYSLDSSTDAALPLSSDSASDASLSATPASVVPLPSDAQPSSRTTSPSGHHPHSG